jgi:hypothetical protein
MIGMGVVNVGVLSGADVLRKVVLNCSEGLCRTWGWFLSEFQCGRLTWGVVADRPLDERLLAARSAHTFLRLRHNLKGKWGIGRAKARTVV